MKKVILVAYLVLSLFCIHPAQADVLGSAIATGGTVAATAIAGKTAQKLIETARSEANGLLAEAENTGNVLLVRAADELNLTAENVARLLAKQMDVAFEELDEDKRDLLLGLASATKVANDLGDKAYTFKDTLALDVRSILGTIPFVKDKLVLQRISGMSIIHGKPIYKLTIIGSYVGLPGEDHHTELGLSINGEEIKGLRVDPKEIHLAEILIPSEEIEPLFNSKSLAIVPVELTIKQTFKERLWGFLWNRDKEKEYSAKLNLTLYPGYAGKLESIARYQVLGWKRVEDIERTMTHEDHCSNDCRGHHGTTHEVAVGVRGNTSHPNIGDKCIVGASYRQDSGTVGYSVFEGVRVSSDKSRATLRMRFRTRSQTFTLITNIEEYSVLSEKELSSEVDLYFDKTTEIKVPLETKSIFFKGKLITGDSVDMLASEVDADSKVRVVRRLTNTEDKSVIVKAVRPPDV